MIIFLEDGIQELKKKKDAAIAKAEREESDKVNGNKLDFLDFERDYDKSNSRAKNKLLVNKLSEKPNIDEEIAQLFARHLGQLKDPLRSELYKFLDKSSAPFSYRAADLIAKLMIAHNIKADTARSLGFNNKSLVSDTKVNPNKIKAIVYAWKNYNSEDLKRFVDQGHPKSWKDMYEALKEMDNYIKLYKAIVEDTSDDNRIENIIKNEGISGLLNDYIYDKIQSRLELSDSQLARAKQGPLKFDKKFFDKVSKETQWKHEAVWNWISKNLKESGILDKSPDMEKTPEEKKDDSEV